jgi:hypothetical protein
MKTEIQIRAENTQEPPENGLNHTQTEITKEGHFLLVGGSLSIVLNISPWQWETTLQL